MLRGNQTVFVRGRTFLAGSTATHRDMSSRNEAAANARTHLAHRIVFIALTGSIGIGLAVQVGKLLASCTAANKGDVVSLMIMTSVLLALATASSVDFVRKGFSSNKTPNASILSGWMAWWLVSAALAFACYMHLLRMVYDVDVQDTDVPDFVKFVLQPTTGYVAVSIFVMWVGAGVAFARKESASKDPLGGTRFVGIY